MTNVLFVCIGNSCRSQMAEGLGRKYGQDVMRVWSAGLGPAPVVQPLTIEVMAQKNIDISDQFPKSVHELELNAFDLVLNMSGNPLPWPLRGEVREWKVDDPMTQAPDVYVRVRDQIEGLVMQMILDLRRPVVAAAPLPRPVKTPTVAQPARVNRLERLAKPEPVKAPDRTTSSSQKFGFGRVRRARD